jgi:hypothetical protein
MGDLVAAVVVPAAEMTMLTGLAGLAHYVRRRWAWWRRRRITAEINRSAAGWRRELAALRRGRELAELRSQPRLVVLHRQAGAR